MNLERDDQSKISHHALVIADYHCLINHAGETTMAWTTPTLVEICIGLEINGYLPAEF
jgi:coenzyme PQQ precursor peptide PqqA